MLEVNDKNIWKSPQETKLLRVYSDILGGLNKMKFLLVGPAWMRCKAKSEVFFDVTEIYSEPRAPKHGSGLEGGEGFR